MAKFFASLKETPENGTKKPSAKPGTKGRWPKGKANRVPRVKVLNYLKKVALFFRFERDILAVKDRLPLTLATLGYAALLAKELTQHLKVNTVIAEFDVVEIRHDSAKCKRA